MSKAVAYYRVSTEKQGISGLGLDAQKTAVQEFVKTKGLMVIEHFTEIESGKKNARPLLQRALECCRKEKAVLLIAKLDRLGRNMAFIARLMEADVKFIAVDDPHAEDFILHIKAAYAEHERNLISKRTKAALQAAKERGVELGKHGRYVLSQLNRLNSEQFAIKMQPLLECLKGQGITTVRAIASELNRRGTPTFRNQGNRWHPSTVHSVIRQLDKPRLTSSLQSSTHPMKQRLFAAVMLLTNLAAYNTATAQSKCKYVTTQTDPFTHETSSITRHPIGPLMGGWTIVLRQVGEKWFVGIGMQNGKSTTDKLPKGSRIQVMFENGSSTEIVTKSEYESIPLPLNGQQYTQWMVVEEVPKTTFAKFGESPIAALKTSFQFKGKTQEFLLPGIKPKQSERTMETAACMLGN